MQWRGMVCGLIVGTMGAAARGEALEAPALTLAETSATPLAPAVKDTAVRLTLYYENDGGWAKPWDSHDRHYTAGPGASLFWRAPWVNTLLSKVPSFFGEFDRPETTYAMGVVGALTMYTPEDIGNPDAIPDDRPYAGWTYGGWVMQRALQVKDRYTDLYNDVAPLFTPAGYSSFESLELDMGIVGPSSLAQNAQEMIHHEFDYTYPVGWNNQIHDEPEFAIKYNRRWRSQEFLITEAGHMWDVIPDLGLTTGSLMNEAHAGVTFRLGYALPEDFGPGELQNPGSFASRPLDTPISFYVFGRPFGKLVAQNVLIQGDNWRHDDLVTQSIAPAVGGVQFGAVVQFLKYFELGYVTTYQSPEFKGQQGWDSWSSVQMSFSFAW